jgi:hypothetical protein
MRLTHVLAGCLLAAVYAGPASSADVKTEHWLAEGKIIGKKDKKAEDVSGLSCSTTAGFPRTCLIIDDNIQAAQIVTLEDGKLLAGAMVPLIGNTFDGKALELDGEGVAYADGAFYVIGSHGHPRDKDHELDPTNDAERIAAHIAAASQIAKVTVATNGTATVDTTVLSLAKAIQDQPDLKDFAGKRLEENGVTIEGIAIKDGQLFAGFRGPVLSGGHAAVLAVSLDGLATGSDLKSKMFKLPLGEGIGIRDLARDGDRILVLAGPGPDTAGAYTIYSWDGAGDTVTALVSLTGIPDAGDNRKAEVVLPLADKTFLILFDGEKEGGALAITLP